MDILAGHAARHPDKPALIEGDRLWSWATLVERRNRLGHALLGLGLKPGSTVIVYAANSLEHYLAGTGARAAGLIPAPMRIQCRTFVAPARTASQTGRNWSLTKTATASE